MYAARVFSKLFVYNEEQYYFNDHIEYQPYEQSGDYIYSNGKQSIYTVYGLFPVLGLYSASFYSAVCYRAGQHLKHGLEFAKSLCARRHFVLSYAPA